MPAVLYMVAETVAHVTLNRADSGNRIDAELAAALREACARANDDAAVRVLLLDARGSDFSLGASNPERPEPVATAVAEVAKPTLCVLHGDALGQGLELALACDLRIAADTAKFALDQLRSGRPPSDGGTQRLPRLIGRARAIELLLTSRCIDAAEAQRIGLVHEVVEGSPQRRAHELAAHLAALAPIAMAYVKEAANAGVELPLAAGLRLEADLAVLLHTSKDRAAGLAAFLRKRKATFAGE